MKKFSKFNSKKEWEDYVWSKFLENIKTIKSDERLKAFLNDLFSASEKKLIINRLAALAMIRAGKTYKEIEEALWISPSTISALKKSFRQKGAYQSNRYYAERSKQRKRKEIKGLPPQTMFDYWFNFPFPTKTGRGRWKFLYYQG